MHLRPSLAFACCCLASLTAWAEGGVKPGVAVSQKPATVQEKLFDRKHLAETIPLRPQDLAYTDCSYCIAVNLRVEAQSEKTSGGQTTATIKVTGIDAALSLETTLWLPKNPSQKLRDHEQGHRRIGEFFYASADADAKRLCRSYLGQSAVASGATLDEARQKAARTVSDALMKEYLAVVNGKAGKGHVFYDEITAHGTKPIAADAAVKEALARWAKEEAGGKAKEPASH